MPEVDCPRPPGFRGQVLPQDVELPYRTNVAIDFLRKAGKGGKAVELAETDADALRNEIRDIVSATLEDAAVGIKL